jgi:hypothetical protein
MQPGACYSPQCRGGKAAVSSSDKGRNEATRGQSRSGKKYRGQKIPEQDGKSWENAILEDFAELRKAGLSDPLMDTIEKLFKAAT